MDFKEILELACLILCVIGFVCIVIFSIMDIVKSNKYWKKMEAELELYRGTLHKNHELTHAVIDFGDELVEKYYEKAKDEFYNNENDYNHGKLDAVEDIMEFFFKFLEKHIGD